MFSTVDCILQAEASGGRDMQRAVRHAEVATPAPTAQLDPLRIRTNVELAAIELLAFQKAGLMNLEAMKANILARQPRRFT